MGAWGELIRLVSPQPEHCDRFGRQVSLDRDTLVVGADGQGFDTAGWYYGAAFIFERNLGAPNAWGLAAIIDSPDQHMFGWFGGAVGVEGDTVVIGASAMDYVNPGNPNCDSGAVFVFDRNQGGSGQWGQVAMLTASDASCGAGFGYMLDISENTLVVTGGGGYYVFYRTDPGAQDWFEHTKLPHLDFYGGEIAVNDDTLVVGAERLPYNCPPGFPDCEHGGAYVFERDHGGSDNWGLSGTIGRSQETYHLGKSVDVDGDTIVLGTPWDWEIAPSAGAVAVFARDGGAPEGWREVQKIIVPEGTELMEFGFSLSIDGETLVVGAEKGMDYEHGEARVYLPALFFDGFESGDTSAWSLAVP
jgi:hypothetical protein